MEATHFQKNIRKGQCSIHCLVCCTLCLKSVEEGVNLLLSSMPKVSSVNVLKSNSLLGIVFASIQPLSGAVVLYLIWSATSSSTVFSFDVSPMIHLKQRILKPCDIFFNPFAQCQ